MKLAIVKERRVNERRVAATPDSVKHLVGLGLEAVVESGAGSEAQFADDSYTAAGATIASDEAAALRDADIVLKVQRPLMGGEDGLDELSLMKHGAVLIGLLRPLRYPADAETYARAGVTAFAMEETKDRLIIGFAEFTQCGAAFRRFAPGTQNQRPPRGLEGRRWTLGIHGVGSRSFNSFRVSAMLRRTA